MNLEYCDIEWFVLEMNWDHSVIFEIAAKYCILYCFVDYEGYSISSKGFLPTVVDIWSSDLKFPIPVYFSSLIPKILMFILAISCLTTSNLLWFMNLDHFQFTLIRESNIPGSYTLLFFTGSDFTFTTRHIHNWALFPPWSSLFILSGAISLVFSSSILGTY